MSKKKIDYKILLNRDGETQTQRKVAALQPEYTLVDNKSSDEIFEYIKTISDQVKFFNKEDFQQQGTWKELLNFSKEELEALALKNNLSPHIGLLKTFLELRKFPQQLMNDLTRRHLNYYYGDVLQINKLPAVADKAHVVFELKKKSEQQLLETGTLLKAGKDQSGKDLFYELMHDIVVNESKVESLKSLTVNPSNKNFIHVAPISNSADGLGKKIEGDEKKWNAFGSTDFQKARIGFCLASPVLMMAEGERIVTVTIALSGLSNFSRSFFSPRNIITSKIFSPQLLYANLFDVSLTGAKGWIDVKGITPAVTTDNDKNSVFTFSFTIPETDPAVVNYDSAKHGSNFETVSPLMQVLVNNEKTNYGYDNLKNAKLVSAKIDVDVKGVKTLTLENDNGSLNSKKPFLPFGALPIRGSGFDIGSDECFTKKLKNFSLDVEWKNIPANNLATYYNGYTPSISSNSVFSANMFIKDGGGWEAHPQTNLFNTQAMFPVTWSFNNPAFPSPKPLRFLEDVTFHKMNTMRSKWAARNFSGIQLSNRNFTFRPDFSLARLMVFLLPPTETPALKRGFIRMVLNHSFLHSEFPFLFAKNMAEFARNGGTLTVINPPFSPEIKNITLNYSATSGTILFNDSSLENFVNNDLEFFHVTAFGQMREHPHPRSLFSFVGDSHVSLLQQYRNEGELYVGLSEIKEEDSVCLLVQVAEGSANPEKDKLDLKWSVLCDNYWKDLSDYDFVFDTTNDFLISGVVKIVIPKEATTGNSILQDGYIWLRVAAQNNSDAICNIIDIQSNGAISQFKDFGNDPLHLASSLPAGTISKLVSPVASIKKTEQPYSSFGGALTETDSQYLTRVSERLRHKQRAIALWDYEHIVLQNFSKIYKAKILNHCSPTSFYHPGNVSIIVVPDLNNRNAMDPLQPKVDKNTLDEILTFIQKQNSSWVAFHVANPQYEPVQIQVNVHLRKGFEFGYYQNEIEKSLIEFLSPWAFGNGNEIHFGGKIHKSSIVKVLEDLEFVDFVTDLKMFQSLDGGKTFEADSEFCEASTPRSILVSHNHHTVTSL